MHEMIEPDKAVSWSPAPFFNSSEFSSAIDYVNTNLLSKPYTITGMFDRWFFMLAEVEVQYANQQTDIKLIHGREFVDIYLDGEKVTPQQIESIYKFHSRHSRAAVNEEEEALRLKLESLEQSKYDEAYFNYHRFLDEKHSVAELYNKIVERGTLVIDTNRLESHFKCKILNINHRPNHDLNHSVRVAYFIKIYHAFNQEHQMDGFQALSSNDLEKLQLMMLFSVVGRRDETGFHDEDNGCATYQSFRAVSGREYLTYCLDKPKLYDPKDPNNLENIFRDALVVEIMGYPDLPSEWSGQMLLIDYVIAKEQSLGRECSEVTARQLIENETYTLSQLIGPEDRANYGYKLRLMNQAHGSDLARCYPLFKSGNGPGMCRDIYSDLILAGVLNSLSEDNTDKANQQIRSVLNLYNASFEALKQTGQGTYFTMISSEEFDEKKDSLMKNLVEINQKFQDSKQYGALFEEMKNNQDFLKYVDLYNYEFTEHFSQEDITKLLESYRKYLILHNILTSIVNNRATPSTTLKFNCFSNGAQSGFLFVKLFEKLLPASDMISSEKKRIKSESEAGLPQGVLNAIQAVDSISHKKTNNDVLQGILRLTSIAEILYGKEPYDLSEILDKPDEPLLIEVMDDQEFDDYYAIKGKDLANLDDKDVKFFVNLLKNILAKSLTKLTGSTAATEHSPVQVLTNFKQEVEKKVPDVLVELKSELQSVQKAIDLLRSQSEAEKSSRFDYQNAKTILLHRQHGLIIRLDRIQQKIFELNTHNVNTKELRDHFSSIARDVYESIKSVKSDPNQSTTQVIFSLREYLKSEIKGFNVLKQNQNKLLVVQAEKLLDSIGKSKMGDDPSLDKYLIDKQIEINQALSNQHLELIVQRLKKTSEAVNSKEMVLIKDAYYQLSKKSFFDEKGKHQKASEIAKAVSNVPVEDRASIFSKNKAVRQALASHRNGNTKVFYCVTNPNELDESKAAKSFKKIKAKLDEIKDVSEIKEVDKKWGPKV